MTLMFRLAEISTLQINIIKTFIDNHIAFYIAQ